MPDEPIKCTRCEGKGYTWRWRMDDQLVDRYPKRCGRCNGTGIDPNEGGLRA